MRWEFRNVALSTQDMAPDTVLYPFFISGILDAKDGWNVLGLGVFRWSDFTGITFAFLRRFRELARNEVGLLCLALTGGRSVVTPEGHARELGNGF
jgi:hypothetical protein